MFNAYFVSDINCALKVNGAYKGIIGKNLSHINIEEGSLLEFLPLRKGFAPIYSIDNSKLVKSLKVKGGVLYYPVFQSDFLGGFKLLGQRRTNTGSGEIMLTLTVDGTVKFYIDGLFNTVSCLPFIPTDFDLVYKNNYVIAVFSADKTAVFVYDLSGNKVFKTICDSVSIEQNLTVKTTLGSAIRTNVISEYSLVGEFKKISTTEQRSKTFYDISPNLFTLAFFECAVIGCDVKALLAPQMHEKAGNLKDFLGNIIKVLPSPNNVNEVWLVSNNEVAIGKLEIKNGLVHNVYLNDF